MSPLSLSSLVFFAVIFSTECSLLGDPEVDLINNIITDANSWLEDHLKTETRLPDLGQFFFEPLKLRNGRLGQFNTMQLVGTPKLVAEANQDGSTTFTFDVRVGLKDLFLQYDYQMNLFGYQTVGQVTLTPQENEVDYSGIAVFRADGTYCDTRLDGFKISKLGDYKLDVKSEDHTTHITEILNIYLSPIVLSIINTSFQGFTYAPGVQSNFRHLVCKQFSM